MCRLYFAPKAKNEERLATQFDLLEASMGGQGNGIALLGGEQPELIKGVQVTTGTLAKKAVEHAGPFMFHTRIASIGGVVDSLCQPFKIGLKKPAVVAHNGHWGWWEKGLELLLMRGKMQFVPLHLSDSLIGAMLAKHYGPGALRSYVKSGVWLYAQGEGAKLQVMAVVNDGSFCVNMRTGEAASEAVLWGADDVQWVRKDSVVALWPEIKVISGGFFGLSKKERRELNKRKGGLGLV